MNNREAYNKWSSTYDTDENKTRDLEARVLREILNEVSFRSCLEIGCGTGKNTVWLAEKCKVTSVDFSEKMLKAAKDKITSENVQFIQADITEEWKFGNNRYDLITFSLVLEHIKDISSVLKYSSGYLNKGGYIYIGELHPFKQYKGSKARFTQEGSLNVLDCYIHNVSEYIETAASQNFQLINLKEYFDSDADGDIPRILALLFRFESDEH